jgi:hypothetical protein
LNSQSGSHSSSWEVWRESSNNGSLVSVWLTNLSPDGSEFASLFLIVSFIDIDYSLTKIVLGVLSSVDILESKDGLIGGLVLSVSSEAEEFGLDPESNRGFVVFGSRLSFDHWFIIFLIFKIF